MYKYNPTQSNIESNQKCKKLQHRIYSNYNAKKKIANMQNLHNKVYITMYRIQKL